MALQERNLRLHLLGAALVLAAGYWCVLSSWQWGLLITAIALVLVAELLNTSLEYVVDLASPGYAELAGRAKDVAAGAVLFTALAALALGNLVFAPEVQPLFDHLRGLGTHVRPIWLGMSVFVSASSLMLSWRQLGGRQRDADLRMLVVMLLCARLFATWPGLPTLTIWGGATFFAVVLADGCPNARSGLGILAWSAFWLLVAF